MGLALLPMALLILPALLLWPTLANDSEEPNVRCGACRALMDEVEYDVTKARQKKTKVGSYRIRPDGTQERKKVAEKELCASV
eukprot:XP_008760849.1 PREDICTED: protein canopy homolog 1-like [Rattus norvegicus]